MESPSNGWLARRPLLTALTALLALPATARAQSAPQIVDLGNFGGDGSTVAVVGGMNDGFEIAGSRIVGGASQDFFWKDGQVSTFGALAADGISNGVGGFAPQLVGATVDDGAPVYARWFSGGSVETLPLPATAPWDPSLSLIYQPTNPAFALKINSAAPVTTILGKASYNTDPHCSGMPFAQDCLDTLQDTLFLLRRSADPAVATPQLAFVLRLDGSPAIGRFNSQYRINGAGDLLFDVDGSIYLLDGASLAIARINGTGVPVGFNNARQAVLVRPDGSSLWSPTASAEIRAPSGGIVVGEDLNNSGVVSGRVVSGGGSRAFIYSAAHGFRLLDEYLPANSGWQLVEATRINDTGGVEGIGLLHGVVHHYLLRFTSSDPAPTVSSVASVSLAFQDLQCLKSSRRQCVINARVLDTQSQPVSGQNVVLQRQISKRVHRHKVLIDQTLAAAVTDVTGLAQFVLKRPASKPVLRTALAAADGTIVMPLISSGYQTYKAPKKSRH